MACRPTPAAAALLSQASARWPNRSTATDGICPSAAHTAANPTSDHEWGGAVDLTKDLAAGVDTGAIAELIRTRSAAGEERRASYVISDGRIASASRGWEWRPYTGSNPHTSHVHVSLTREGASDGSSDWFGGKGIKDPLSGSQSGSDGPTTPLSTRGGNSLVPGSAEVTIGGVPIVGEGLANVAALAQLLTDGRTWLRVLGVLGGVVLILVGAALLGADLAGVRKLASGLVSARTGGAVQLPEATPPAPRATASTEVAS